MVEKLTDAVISRLVGHANVVYYNCDTNTWNTKLYNGYKINSNPFDIKLVKEFKTAMDAEPEFNRDSEFVASVTMTIDLKFYPGRHKTVVNPQYDKTGKGVVGNIIVRNKQTGKCELYGKSWLGVYDYYCQGVAVYGGALRFAELGARGIVCRKALIAAHTR